MGTFFFIINNKHIYTPVFDMKITKKLDKINKICYNISMSNGLLSEINSQS